jgi:sugar/nucleoside kinase (ribokinase family)
VSVIASIGHLSRDVVADASPRPGGPVFYSAQALARIGADAQIAASCARRDRAELVVPLEAFGLPVTWYESARTAAFRFRYAGSGRRIMRLEAVGEPWSPEDAVLAVGEAHWVHVGALVRTDFPARTLAALAGEERKLLVDAQGLVRTPALGPLRTNGAIGDVLRYVSILKLDVDEAKALVGSADPDRLLSLDVKEVILTLGPKGSVVITAGRFEPVDAIEVERTVDPTGAGDTFSASYLAARSAGAAPVEAARTASEAVAEFLADG